MSTGAAVFPFGKFKGKPLAEIDADYLSWAITNVEFRSSQLRQAVVDELHRRDADPAPDRPARAQAPHRTTGARTKTITASARPHCATCRCSSGDDDAPF